jgi:uncharacterized protein (DUF433 family)
VIAWEQYISSNPNICGGELCITRIRITITIVLDCLVDSSREEVLQSYPSLGPEHISAVLAYAAELAREQQLIPIRGR